MPQVLQRFAREFPKIKVMLLSSFTAALRRLRRDPDRSR